MRTFLAIFAVACIAAACQSSNVTPEAKVPQSQPEATPVPADACATDKDCPNGLLCEQRIHAACPTCDGGPLIRVCEQAKSCAGDQSLCGPGRTCVEVPCPTCLEGKDTQCR